MKRKKEKKKGGAKAPNGRSRAFSGTWLIIPFPSVEPAERGPDGKRLWRWIVIGLPSGFACEHRSRDRGQGRAILGMNID